MVLAALVFEMLENQCFQQHYFWKCCKTNGSSNIVFGSVARPMPLATLVWKYQPSSVLANRCLAML